MDIGGACSKSALYVKTGKGNLPSADLFIYRMYLLILFWSQLLTTKVGGL